MDPHSWQEAGRQQSGVNAETSEGHSIDRDTEK